MFVLMQFQCFLYFCLCKFIVFCCFLLHFQIFWYFLCISVAFGVLFGTIIILFYFPVLILYFNDIRRARWWFWRGGKTAPEKLEVEPVIKNLIRTNEFSELDKTFNPEVSSAKFNALEKQLNELKAISAAQADELTNLKKSPQ